MGSAAPQMKKAKKMTGMSFGFGSSRAAPAPGCPAPGAAPPGASLFRGGAPPTGMANECASAFVSPSTINYCGGFNDDSDIEFDEIDSDDSRSDSEESVRKHVPISKKETTSSTSNINSSAALKLTMTQNANGSFPVSEDVSKIMNLDLAELLSYGP